MYFIYKKLNFNLLYIVDIIIKCQHCNDFNIEIIFKQMYNVFMNYKKKGFYSKKEYFYAYEAK